MPELGADPTIADIQKYVRQLEDERGFTTNTIEQTALLLGEEVGELFKALRKHQNMPVDANSHVREVDGELADVLIYVCALANRADVDLETAFRAKEEVNKRRVWTTRPQS